MGERLLRGGQSGQSGARYGSSRACRPGRDRSFTAGRHAPSQTWAARVAYAARPTGCARLRQRLCPRDRLHPPV